MAASIVSAHGYTVLRTKLSPSCSDDICHFVYVTEHKARGVDESKPSGRTVFVLSVPPYYDEASFQRLFGDCGEVERVNFEARHNSIQTLDTLKSYRVAYVVFKNKASAKKVLQMSFNDIRVVFPEEAPEIGMKKWCKLYAKMPPNVEVLEKECEKYISRFEKKQAKEVADALATEGVPDDEGWIMVGKNKGIARTELHETKTKKKNNKKNKEKELLHFYAHQIRDSKKEFVTQMREKFEEDKQKIAVMKAARKFKPY